MPESPEQRNRVAEASVAAALVDVADALVQSVRAGFGALSLTLALALRALTESAQNGARDQRGLRVPASDVADLLFGTAWGAARLSGRLTAMGARVAAPLCGLALRPPLLPRRLQPVRGVQKVVRGWQRDRPETLHALGRWPAAALPGALDAMLAQVDARQVAAVALDRVDLDVLVTDLVRRVDVTAITIALLQGLDLTSIAAIAIQQTDLDRAVDDALGRLDVDQVVARLLDQLDLTQLVLDRVDLQRVVECALEHLDLPSIVVDQVNLGGVVDAALQQMDLTQIVLQQVDLLGVAGYVAQGIDLPELIRESTGSVASEAVVGLRMQAVDADAVVVRVVDRILRRHGQRRTERAPGPAFPPDLPVHASSGSNHEPR